jgi:carboxyl-terminal processing protease
MKNLKRRTRLGGAVALLLALIISLTSCFGIPFSPDPAVDEQPKETILENIAETEKSNTRSYDHFGDYLVEWGFPAFDEDKVIWAEAVMIQHYYYDGGIPSLKADVMPRAAAVARIFLDSYYDEIDRTNKNAVTDAIINSLVEFSGDPYGIYRIPEASEDHDDNMSGTFGGIGVIVEYNDVDLTVMISEVMIGSPAEKAGIKVGDLVYAVDGILISEVGHRNAINYVRGEVGTTVRLTVLRDGELLELTAVRELVEVRTVGYGITEQNYGYIQVTSFKDNTDEQFAEAIDALVAMEVDGIIIDMRNNLGGYVKVAANMVSYLLPTGLDIISYDYKSLPDKVLYTAEDTTSSGEKLDSVVDIPIVILCNEYTASASEIFTSVIRDYSKSGVIEATIVGMPSYKKGIIQSAAGYSDGSTLTITYAYYRTPLGELIHGVGITPDVIVENTETEDLQFFAAIEEMQKLLADK